MITRNFHRIVLFLLFSSFFCRIYASEVIYNRNEQMGLTFLYLSNIIEDRQGYMWFGTIRGLNRWDGYKYDYFLSNKDDSTSISSNRVQSLFIDRNNFMWVGTDNGLNRFNPKSEIFTHYFHSPSDSGSISSNNILCITGDKNGNLWIGTDNGVNIYKRSTNSFQHIDVQKLINIPEEDYHTIRFIHCDKRNTIWIGFRVSGVLKINPDNLENTFYLKDKFNHYISSINDIDQLDNNHLLLSTWGNKAFVYSQKDDAIAPWEGNKLISSDIIDFARVDSSGTIWVADHFNQIINLTPDLKVINVFSVNSNLNKIPSNQISSIFVDRRNIWFGTYSQGFFQIKNSKRSINDLARKSPELNQLAKVQVTSLATDRQGKLFIGTSNHLLYIYDETTGILKKINVSCDVINHLHFDPFHNRIFPGTFSDHLNYIDLNTFQERTFATYNVNYTIMDFAENEKKLFIALWSKGINYLNPDGSVHFTGNNDQERSFSSLNMFLEKDTLWIATAEHGLAKYNIATNKFSFYPIAGDTKSINPINQVNIVKRLKNGELIVSTNELGLCIFDEKKNTYTQVGTDNGINNAHIKAILEDDSNNIWIISAQKIIKTDYNFINHSEYTFFDGLNIGIEHLGATYSPLSKNIYIGGQQGVQYFQTTDMITDTSFNHVIITDFKIFEKTITAKDKILNGKSISYTDSITLSHNSNFITISFSAMRYFDQTNRQFSYKLKGVNNQWITVPYTKNSVTYSNLGPGDYDFLVKVSTDHGEWNDEMTKLHIHITPPFWETNGFKLMIVLFFASIVGVYIKYREYKYLKEKKNLERIVKERTAEIVEKNKRLEQQKEELVKVNDVKNKFFNIIAHDLKNPVSSMVQLIDLAYESFDRLSQEQHKEIISSASVSANSTLQLLEDLLIWARTQTGKITYHFEKINMYELVKDEINYLLQQALVKQITIKNNLLRNTSVYADISSLKTVFRNLISNAIKFTQKGGTIKIGCHISENNLIVYVKDNGIGMSGPTLEKLFVLSEKQSIDGTMGEKGTGLGLNLCEEFITKNGGKIWVESKLNEGSTFYFTIPLYENGKEAAQKNNAL